MLSEQQEKSLKKNPSKFDFALSIIKSELLLKRLFAMRENASLILFCLILIRRRQEEEDEKGNLSSI